MFGNCKNKYEACAKIIDYVFDEEYRESLTDEEYQLLVRTAELMFDGGMRWQREQMKKTAVEGVISSTVTGSEQYVSANIGYGEYGNDGDKIKIFVFPKED